MKNDRIWERYFAVVQTLFSFHAARQVLLLRGLFFLIVGVLGLFEPLLIVKIVTGVIGVVLLMFAAASFLMAWRSGRGSASLLFLFVLLGAVGLGMLIYPLYFDAFLMFVFGVWLIFVGVWNILSSQKRFGRLVLPMPGLVATLIGILLVVAPFIGVAAISWTAALLILLSGVQMLLLAIGIDAGKWVFPAPRK